MIPEPEIPASPHREDFLRGHAPSGRHGVWAGKTEAGRGGPVAGVWVVLAVLRVGLPPSCGRALVDVHGGKKVGDVPLEPSFNAGFPQSTRVVRLEIS